MMQEAPEDGPIETIDFYLAGMPRGKKISELGTEDPSYPR